MKKILLLSTGGTIASQKGEHGLAPSLDDKMLVRQLAPYLPGVQLVSESVLSLDSSNIQPEHWQIVARRLYQALPLYDGIIVTHGTDTMAYTAAAVSFMLPGLNKSVVFTGSQLPIDNPLTDAKTNIYTAIAAIESGITGVTVAFNRKIIAGTRAVKITTMGFDAFDSVNSACLGQAFADGMRVYSPGVGAAEGARLEDTLCFDVFLLKLIPGTKPAIFDMLADSGYRGIVVEAFGAGGVHFIDRDILAKLNELRQRGVAVVVCSQCLYERSDLSIYEVGKRMLDYGVISARDMTTEAAVTKLMWALGRAEGTEDVARIFAKSYVGEITL